MIQGSSFPRASASRGPALAALAAAILLVLLGLQRIYTERALLGVVLGHGRWILAGGFVLGLSAGGVALARELAALRRGEPRTSWSAPLCSLFVAAVVCWSGFLALVESFEWLWLELVLAAGAAAWCAWIARLGPAPPAPLGWRRVAALLVLGLAAAAPLLEIGLRLYARVRPSPLFARPIDAARVTAERARFRPGRLHFGFACNRGGHFDDEFARKAPGERLVATIGDSFSIGVVPHAYHFTTVCEEALGVPVCNLGMTAIGPREYRDMLLAEALALAPDAIVVDLFVGNDFELSTESPGAFRQLVESWFGRSNVLLVLIPKRLARLSSERWRSGKGAQVASVQGAQHARDAERDPESPAEAFPWVADPRLERETFTAAGFLAIERRRALHACRLVPADFEPLHALLLEMKRAAAPIPLGVMLIPDEFQIEDELWAEILASAPSGELDRDRVQRHIVPWLEEHGIPCLDLTPRLRAVPPLEDGRRHLYHLRDTHFNAHGNRVAGEALAEFFATRLGLGERR